ncbi:hypothetical protein Hypma_006647 [Hypsizygus marmoreus]|uniref:Fido domain-containing protein n=1 Tax=Hypsizygus marmoreus TaxID=39966 RepID=A0A369JZL5_HYPMA|nr:hypothetical protein Hypma_006647 [Hypsizygus marmoreus]
MMQLSQTLSDCQTTICMAPPSLIHAQRLARLFTPTYAQCINAQLVHPAPSQVVKPNELSSALARPLQVAHYEPERSPAYLAATLSYGLIKGHPFLDGNKRTAFFLANEYLRAHGLPGLVEEKVKLSYTELTAVADQYIGVASGRLPLDALLRRTLRKE